MPTTDSPPPQSVSTRVAKGAGWILGFKLLERSIGLISTLILARLLVPADFGIIAMATSLMAVLEMLTSFKFDTVLIQRPHPTVSDYNTAWTLNTAFGLFSAVAMLLLASPLADFYRNQDVFHVVVVLAMAPFVQSVANVGMVEFRRNLEFRQDFVIQASKKIGAFVITIPAALLLRSYWALVAGMLAGSIISTVLTYRMHPHRPSFTLASARNLMGFSIWTLISAGLNTARLRVSHFVLGRLGGADQLGLFSMATDIATMTTTELVMPVNRAVYPAYARMATEPNAIARGYMAVLQLIALAIAPTAVGTITVAHLAIPLLLGANWNGVIPLVTPMALFGLGMALQTNAMPIYWAVGRPKLGAMMSALLLLILVALMLPLTASFGARGTALACMVAAITTVPITFWVIARLLGLRARNYLSALWRPTTASLVMFAAVTATLGLLETAASPRSAAVALIIAVLAGVVTYVVSIAALWRISGSPEGAESFIATRLASAWIAFSHRHRGA